MKLQISQRPQQNSDEAQIEIEGGEIKGFDFTESVHFHVKKHRADTERKLAYRLVWLLGGSWLLYFAATFGLEIYGKHEAAESLGKAFNIWLPVVSSLVSSVVTYYFTRENK